MLAYRIAKTPLAYNFIFILLYGDQKFGHSHAQILVEQQNKICWKGEWLDILL